MDRKKQKRMLSNRESARRSRIRKQKHLDDLRAQVSQLRQENSEILAAWSLATKNYLALEAENSVLRTQMMELSSRLQSLDDILHLLNGSFSTSHGHQFTDGSCNPWNPMYMNQPIMASADLLQYYMIT
ncbi:bZIP transcription factor 11 [Cocos nucifera]|uniref:BZIP transcription factor 11 n=1 Tax=Cocos nucifera TaxID=13894 RepID=A0A8K0NCD9_COCNU|nr:bZIP transcription factor 11 [Cocos nucifera]